MIKLRYLLAVAVLSVLPLTSIAWADTPQELDLANVEPTENAATCALVGDVQNGEMITVVADEIDAVNGVGKPTDDVKTSNSNVETAGDNKAVVDDVAVDNAESEDGEVNDSGTLNSAADSIDELDPVIDFESTEQVPIQNGWYTQDEKTYYYENGIKHLGWLVVGQEPFGEASGLQRYWLDDQGALTFGLIDAGDGYFAYGIRNKGYVVRGSYLDPETGYWYFADNDGRLMSPGWNVTGDYTGGWLERYYIDEVTHAAIPGTTDAGYRHHTRSDTGYVARHVARLATGEIYLADNDGNLLPEGWNVTGVYTSGLLERYYILEDGRVQTGFFRVDGKPYFGWRGVAYVLRGKWMVSENNASQYFLADNDGVLEDNAGWLITGAYDSDIQRYWLESLIADGFFGARLGWFVVNGYDYYGRWDAGYVVRGLYQTPEGRWVEGDNDGVAHYVNAWYIDMLYKAQGYASPTNWLILVDCTGNRVAVYWGYQGNWQVQREFRCTSGAWSSPTVKGEYYVANRGYSFGSGYTCYYWTQFYGNYLFHSILYNQGTYTVQDGRLGINASHGCVRLAIENAKYIYDTIPRGTKVVSY